VTTLPIVCILAGGLGVRLGDRVVDTPKPLIDVAGQPFLFHQLQLLARHGATHVVLCVGYRGEQIERVVGKSQFGIDIAYSYDSAKLDGTLGAIRTARGLLGDRFLVLYGDTYLRLDYGAAVARWRESTLPGLMVVLENRGRWDTSNAVYRAGVVVNYDKGSSSPDMRWIDYGLGGLTRDALDLASPGERDLATLYRRLASAGLLCGYEATERFYEIGRPEALLETDRFLRDQG
jgi:MurNAc alpha-1-phosphate uridylyltransferase